MPPHTIPTVAIVLIDFALIVAATRVVGAAFRRLGQPAVVGEILAGIALGPSLLGAIPVGETTLGMWLFPEAARRQLDGLATLGLTIFMMIVGLELNLRPVRQNGRRAVVVSVASILVPLTCGVLLGGWLRPDATGTARLAFLLFVGVAMSVTAFPVLARILVERRMHRTPLGVLVLACAGVDDVLAWCLLALATAVSSGGSPLEVLRVLGLLAVYCVVLIGVVRPLLTRLSSWHRRVGQLTPGMLAVVLIGLAASAAATELIGVHFVFGAFLFGAVLPRTDSAGLIRDLLSGLERIAVLALLPVFFVITGLKVDLRGFGAHDFGVLVVVLVLACAGKFLGAYGGARLTRTPNRQAVAIGVLMNTRGLTELVVVTVGFEAGIIDRNLFTILVLMAVLTTIMTKPLLRLAYPDRLIARDVAAAEQTEAGPRPYQSLVVVRELTGARGLLDLAVALAPRDKPARILLCWLDPAPVSSLELGSGLAHGLTAVSADLEAANELAAAASHGQLECTVSYRTSADPQAILAAQVEEFAPDCVVLGPGTSATDNVLPRLPIGGYLVAVDGDPAAIPALLDDGVTVRQSAGPDAVASLRLAARLAHGRSAPLHLVETAVNRRWARTPALVQRLTQAGLTVRTVDGRTAPTGLPITERNGPVSATTQLRVHAADLEDPAGITADLGGVPSDAAPQSHQPAASRSRT